MKKVLFVVLSIIAHTTFAQWTNLSTDRVYTTRTVGIGTSSPSMEYKLDVNGFLRLSRTLEIQGPSSIRWRIHNDNNSGLRIFPQGGSTATLYHFMTHPTQGGFLGVNKADPQSNLHVHGRAYFGNGFGDSPWAGRNGSLLVLDWVHQANWGGNVNNWAGYIGFNAERYNGSNKDWYKGLNGFMSKGAIEFGNKGFRFMFRNVNNNDSDGSHKLEEVLRVSNNGVLFAKEINVSLPNTWPDFVFAKDYELMSLTETAKFIEKNHHLPGIPKAEILDTAGVNLGEMQRLQMMKIEEITLHLITVANEKDQLAEENKALKARLEELAIKQEVLFQELKKINTSQY